MAVERVASRAAPPFDTPALNDAQQRVVDSLRDNGIAVIPFQDLFDESVWNELRADIKGFVDVTEEDLRTSGITRKTKKDAIIRRRYLDRAKGAPKPQLTLDNPWLRVVSSDTMLGIINTYRDQLTRLHYLDSWYTVPYPDADKRISSQRWHRDPEEAHVVKVFLYVNDVDEEAGPFEYVRSSTTGGRYGELWPWEEESSFYPPGDELMAAVAPEDVLTLTGAAGTLIFCDTGGFHRGGFARTKPRILFMCSYVSPATGKGHRFVLDFDGREAELSPAARFALD
jgi:hypothetical protein